MRLYEEYLNRHNIEIPIIHHAANSVVLLRDSGPHKWIFLTIKWVENSRGTGIYDIGIKLPIHNGYEKHIFNSWYSVSKKWDEYEDFILNWSQSLKSVIPIKNSEDIMLDAFEMFVFIFDSWFDQQSHELKKALFEVLDIENPLRLRYNSFQDILVHLSTYHSEVFRIWRFDISDYLPYYSDWLVTLVENQCKKNILPLKLQTQ